MADLLVSTGSPSNGSTDGSGPSITWSLPNEATSLQVDPQAAASASAAQSAPDLAEKKPKNPPSFGWGCWWDVPSGASQHLEQGWGLREWKERKRIVLRKLRYAQADREAWLEYEGATQEEIDAADEEVAKLYGQLDTLERFGATMGYH